jgi:cysteine desulfurase
MALNDARDPIYLDHNATTPIHPRVVEAMLPYLRDHFGNPSSGHVYGQRANRAVEHARERVAALLGCQPDEIVFTSGGTEANNLAIRGVLDRSSARRHVVTSTVEHPATARPCELLERQGVEVTRLPVDSQGRVLVEEARAFVRGDTALVTVMLAQNETGTLMPIAELAKLAHARGALVHTDAAQAVGKVQTRVDDLGVDLLSIAGHKLYAPKGVGALFVRRGTSLGPVLVGAGHERGLRPGTENVPFIVGLGAACELVAADLDVEPSRQRALRDELWKKLSAAIPGIAINGHPTERLPNTLNVAFPGARGSAVLAAAPEIAASTGSACHEGGESPSDVLTAMGLDATAALGAVRLSLGRSTTDEQIDLAAQALTRAWRESITRTGASS